MLNLCTSIRKINFTVSPTPTEPHLIHIFSYFLTNHRFNLRFFIKCSFQNQNDCCYLQKNCTESFSSLEPSCFASFGWCIPSWYFSNRLGKEMDMNPFKPTIQKVDEFYAKILSTTEPLNKFCLKLLLTKATI